MDTSMELPVSPMRIAMNIGALTAVLMLGTAALGWQIMGWIVFAGGVYYGMKCFRRETGGYISYGGAVNAGFQTAFFASLIMAFVGYVTTTIEPSSVNLMFDVAEQRLKTSGFQAGLVDVAMNKWREMFSPLLFAVIIIFTYSAIGGVASIISASFVRKAQPPDAII